MHTVTAISGHALKNYLSSIKSDLADVVDPEGTSVVDFSMVNNDGDSIRAFLLVKCKNQSEAVEAKIDFPIKVYQAISQRLTMPDNPDVIN